MRWFVILLVFSAVAAGQEVRDGTARTGTSTYTGAVAKGCAQADADLASGEASIWTYGLNPKLISEPLDRETGLYFSSFGCVIDDEIIGRVDGHNARIAEHVRAHGPPTNSFKPWEKELFGLKNCFETRCRTEKPIRLTVGGPPAVSTAGQYAVKLVKHADRTLDGQPTESTWIVVGDLDIECKRTPLWPMKDAELFWGPKGSWFAVLRGNRKTSDQPDYMALDLRRVRTLRLEFGKRQLAKGDADAARDPYDCP